MFNRDMKRWFLEDLGSFPSFGSMMTEACFQLEEKYSVCMQPFRILLGSRMQSFSIVFEGAVWNGVRARRTSVWKLADNDVPYFVWREEKGFQVDGMTMVLNRRNFEVVFWWSYIKFPVLSHRGLFTMGVFLRRRLLNLYNLNQPSAELLIVLRKLDHFFFFVRK